MTSRRSVRHNDNAVLTERTTDETTMTEERQNNGIPLPGEADARAQKINQLRPYLLDPREDYPEPYYMLEYNGVPFSTIGGLGAISGQKKNGKSFVLTQMMAAILGQESERAKLFLPGLKVPERTIEYLGHLPRVLYVDTEMEQLYSAKVLRRVHWLCDWDLKLPNDRFNVLWVKNMPDGEAAYKKRLELIKMAVEVLEPDAVFIDGIRDLLSTINDETEGTQVLDSLSKMATERKMCIWNALHQNPQRGDAEDAKMRGWIGTELGNKGSDTLISIKTKTGSGVTFTVKQQDARGKDMEDWKFAVTDDAGNLGVPKIISNGSSATTVSMGKATGDDMADVERWFHECKGSMEWPATRQAVKEKIIRDYGKQTNKTKQDIDLKMLLNKRLLIESTVKQNGYFLLVPNEDEEQGDPLPEPPKGNAPF